LLWKLEIKTLTTTTTYILLCTQGPCLRSGF
jgi:hypothetical protein